MKTRRRFQILNTIYSILIFQGIFLYSGFRVDAAVFGEDDRHEVFEAPADLQQLARSIAVEIPAEMVPDSGGIFNGVPLRKNVCAVNRFSEQIFLPAGACTAFLVAPDLLVTAAHCVKPDVDLCGPIGNFKYVFDYKLSGMGDNSSYLNIPGDNIYKCKAILARRLENFGEVDYAIIKLDRPVKNRPPLELDFEKVIKEGDPLLAIGYPSGLPEKVTDHGFVQEAKSEKIFGSDLDLFSGNSGSPILDEKSKKVVGVSSHGHSDWTRVDSCKMIKQCKVGQCVLSYHSSVRNLKEDLAKILEGGF